MSSEPIYDPNTGEYYYELRPEYVEAMKQAIAQRTEEIRTTGEVTTPLPLPYSEEELDWARTTYEPLEKRLGVKVITKLPAVPEWTHRLVLRFYRLPWANQGWVEAWFASALLPVVNAFEWIVGYTYLRHEIDWEGMTATIYYRAKGTPAVTLAAIAHLIAVIAVLGFAVGFIIFGLDWYVRETREAAASQTAADLLKQGLITKEQYEEIVKAQKENPAPWEKVTEALPTVLMLVLGIAVLGAIPKPRRED